MPGVLSTLLRVFEAGADLACVAPWVLGLCSVLLRVREAKGSKEEMRLSDFMALPSPFHDSEWMVGFPWEEAFTVRHSLVYSVISAGFDRTFEETPCTGTLLA